MKRPRQAPVATLAALAVLAALALPGPAGAWGALGHRTVGEIAHRHLTPEARVAVGELLGGLDLARISSWPDEIRSDPTWGCAYTFHFMTIPPGASYPEEGVEEGDVLEAIVYHVGVLRDGEATRESRRQSLAFLTHFVGDIHQPLHVGLGCDRGANDITTDFFGEERNLHSVWDSGLLEREGLSYTELAAFLDHLGEAEAAALQASTPLDWARESQALLPGVYTCYSDRRADRCPCFCGGCDDGRSVFGGCSQRPSCELMAAGLVRLSWQYQWRNMPVIRERLLAAGVRLAGLLNWVFAEGEPPQAWRELRETMAALPKWEAVLTTFADCRGDTGTPSMETRP